MEGWTLLFAAAAALGAWWQVWEKHAYRPEARWQVWQSDDLREFMFDLNGDAAVYDLHVAARGTGIEHEEAFFPRMLPTDPPVNVSVSVADDVDPKAASVVMSWITHSPRRGRRHWIRTNLATGRRERWERSRWWRRRRWQGIKQTKLLTTPGSNRTTGVRERSRSRWVRLKGDRGEPDGTA